MSRSVDTRQSAPTTIYSPVKKDWKTGWKVRDKSANSRCRFSRVGLFNSVPVPASPHSLTHSRGPFPRRREENNLPPLSLSPSFVRWFVRSSHRFDGSNLRRTFAFYDRRFTTAAAAAPTSHAGAASPLPTLLLSSPIFPLPFPFLMKVLLPPSLSPSLPSRRTVARSLSPLSLHPHRRRRPRPSMPVVRRRPLYLLTCFQCYNTAERDGGLYCLLRSHSPFNTS